MRGPAKLLTLVVALATTAVGVTSTAPARATGGNDRLAPEVLHVSVDRADRLGGSFRGLTGPTTSFLAVGYPTRARVELTVGDIVVTLERDVADGQARWSGGGATMIEAAHASLLALNAAMAREWAPDSSERASLPVLKDLLVRLVELVAEAPIGIVLSAQLVERPTESAGPSTGVAPVRDQHAEAEVCDLDETAASAANAARRTGPQDCQVPDDDGIAYMSCETTTRTLWHDAGNHCFLSEQIWSGPDSDDCLGRCGPGCGLWGGGIYSYDCGEHDRCGRVHGGSFNPWDSECGDEYWDAADDFIWGWPNCPWG